MDSQSNTEYLPQAAPAPSASPLWRVIARALEADIKQRRVLPGDKLPTEQELSLRFAANRHTVRRALAWLQDRGLVESTQGRGSFVRRPAIQFRIGRRTRFSDGLVQAAADPKTETLILDVRACESHVAQALGLKPGAPVIFLERLGLANGEPISLSRHHFSFDRFPTFAEIYARSRSISRTLLDSGVPDYTRKRTRISTRLPTPRECEQLHMPRHVPLIVTQSWNVDGLDRPLEYGEARFASDRVEIEIESEPRPSLD